MSLIVVFFILSTCVKLTGPLSSVNCSIDEYWTIDEIAACTTVECKPGYPLKLARINPGNALFKNIKHLKCSLQFEGSAKYEFVMLETWQWTGQSIIFGRIEEISFPSLKSLKGGSLNIEDSEMLKGIAFNINLKADLNEFCFCNQKILDTENLIKILRPASIYECSVKKIEEKEKKNQEMPEESASTWWMAGIIVAAAVIPMLALSLVAYIYRKEIYPAYYYLIQRINGAIETIQKKRGKGEATVAYQPEAEEEEEAAPSPADDDLTTVPTSSLRRGDLLGRGAFGAVYRVDHPKLGITAAKWYHLEDEDQKKKMMRRGRRESHYGLELRGHPHIVHTLAAIHEDSPESPIGVLCELMQGGDLWSHIKEHPETTVEWRNKWAVDLAKAVEFVHQKRLMHRDVKPTNVLLSTSRTTAKLASFGLMTQVSRGKKHQQGIGNLLYTAPEIFLSRNYGRPVDVYSYGLTLFYVFYGRDPYEPDNYPFGWFSSLTAIPLQDEVNRPDLIGMPVDEIIQKCWKGAPQERIRMEEVLLLLDGPEGRQMFPRVED